MSTGEAQPTPQPQPVVVQPIVAPTATENAKAEWAKLLGPNGALIVALATASYPMVSKHLDFVDTTKEAIKQSAEADEKTAEATEAISRTLEKSDSRDENTREMVKDIHRVVTGAKAAHVERPSTEKDAVNQ